MYKFDLILKEQDEEKRKKMIQERLKFLDTESEQNKTIDVNSIHQGFISSSDSLQFSTDFIMGEFDQPILSIYTMKNQDYFYSYINYLHQNGIVDINTAIHAISPFLKDYFGVDKNGNNKNNREASFDNMGIQLSQIKEKSNQEYLTYYNKWFDIGIFKGNSMAECTEYAALTQNILSFMGFNSYYVSGSFSSSKNNESHAFNLVQTTPEKFFLIDASNPIIMFDEKDNVLTSRTRFSPLSQEQFENAISAQKFELELNVCNYQRINGSVRNVDVDIWKYGIKVNSKKSKR